jgi:glycosyltransferase involved in cell wall biosynthesis
MTPRSTSNASRVGTATEPLLRSAWVDDATVRGVAEPAAGANAAETRPETDRPPTLPLDQQRWPVGTAALVSICSLTYNHAPYIRACIEGFLKQETDFPVEILIHDDASTDGTADIIREFELRFPHLVKPICQTKNQVSQGVRPNPMLNFPRARGRYIAICEGDDYWTSPNKLQAQVDFLETHPGYVACFHNAEILYQDGRPSHPAFSEPLKPTHTIADLVKANVVPNLTIMFRTNLVRDLPGWVTRLPVGDWPLHVSHARHGDFFYMHRVMAVYRVHAEGAWSRLRPYEAHERTIAVAEGIDRNLDYEYTRSIGQSIAGWHYLAALERLRQGIREKVVTHLLLALRRKTPFASRRIIADKLAEHLMPRVYPGLRWRCQRLAMLVGRRHTRR